jgi:hypothetical protein
MSGNHVVTTPFSIHPTVPHLRVRRSDGVVVDLWGHPTGEVVSHPSFAPVLVNGVPYVPEQDDDETTVCHCRRCFLHDDPAGCVAVAS